MATYSTLALAVAACNDNDECGSITDYGCKGNDWITCSGRNLLSSSEGSCAWLKQRKSGKCSAFIYSNQRSIREIVIFYDSY